MISVKYFDLENAFNFVSCGPKSENNAFIFLDTGEIFFVYPWDDDEETPDDINDASKYAAVPDKNDLDLGRNLALSFAEQEIPDDYDDVRNFFRKPGAYARFKDLLEHRGLIEKWYAFEKEATESALREWCEETGIQVADDPE